MDGFTHVPESASERTPSPDRRVQRLAFAVVFASLLVIPVAATGKAPWRSPGRAMISVDETPFSKAVKAYLDAIELQKPNEMALDEVIASLLRAERIKDLDSTVEAVKKLKDSLAKLDALTAAVKEDGPVNQTQKAAEAAKDPNQSEPLKQFTQGAAHTQKISEKLKQVVTLQDTLANRIAALKEDIESREVGANLPEIAEEDPALSGKRLLIVGVAENVRYVIASEITLTPVKDYAVPARNGSKEVSLATLYSAANAKRLVAYPDGKTAGPLHARLAELIKAEEAVTKKFSTAVVDSITSASGSQLVPPSTSPEEFRAVRNLLGILKEVGRLESSSEAKQAKIVLTPGVSATAKTLGDTLSQREVVATLQDPTVGRDAERWTSDYIRLFYFTDVHRLLTTLNPHTRVANPSDVKYQQEAEDALAALNQATQEITVLLSEVNQQQERLGGLEDILAQKKRTAASRDRQYEQARNNQERFATQNADAKDRLKEIDAESADQTTKLNTAKDTIKRLESQATPLSDDQKAELKRAKIDQRDAQRSLDSLAAEKKSLEAGQQARKNPTAVADRAVSDAKTKKDSADADLSTSEEAADGVRSQLNALRTDLIAKQNKLVTLRIKAQQLAINESNAFARARDNAPFFIAPPGGNESDPIRRVVIYGYSDSNTLLIRGEPSDVLAAKELIAQFDRPAPQARITLYTLQVNGTTSTKRSWIQPKARVNPIDKAMSGVKDELRDLRTAISIVQESLRESISREVGRAADLSTATLPDLNGYPRLARYAFYSSEVRRNLGYDLDCPNYSRAMRLRYAHDDHKTVISCLENLLHLPSDSEQAQVLRFTAIHALRRLKYSSERNSANSIETYVQLLDKLTSERIDGAGLSKATKDFYNSQLRNLTRSQPPTTSCGCPDCTKDLKTWNYITKWTLPDPAQVTTLSEMMFVISLASKQSRERVLSTFQDNLFAKLHLGKEGDDKATLNSLGQGARAWRKSLQLAYSGNKGSIYPQVLTTLANGLDNVVSTDPTSSELGSNTLEVLQAIETRAREQVAAEVIATIRSIYGSNRTVKADPTLTEELRNRYAPLVNWLALRLNRKVGATRELVSNGSNNDRESDRRAWTLAQLVLDRNSLSLARPRVAAADEMIKRLILATENDIEHYFVKPTMDAIRDRVRSEGVELGTLEQQSILATNRLVARISTNSSASAVLPGATEFRDEASQLGSILTAAKADQVASGLAIGSLGYAAAKSNSRPSVNASAGSIGAVLGLIDILGTQDAEPRGEVYSINSNGTFKVTPLFDPSGQALQFKFDHVAQTFVRNPDGTSSRELPRIERITVNNTVQLSNLEFREVASYGMNSKIGTPDTRSGGIPIVRDLPVIRDIPLLGYYSRRNSSASTRQESLIFAQTSMYPTVLDITSLMLDVNVPPALDTTPPEEMLKEEVPVVRQVNNVPPAESQPDTRHQTSKPGKKLAPTPPTRGPKLQRKCDPMCHTPGKRCKKCGKTCRCAPPRPKPPVRHRHP